MTDLEHLVVAFLRASPESSYGRREIARKAIKRQQFDENPHWVEAPLSSLLAQHVIEQNQDGLYRLKQGLHG